MDKIWDLPRRLPNCSEYWHFSRLPGSLTQGTDRLPAPGELESGYFSVEDTARLMQGFVPERSFTKDRRVIDMRIDSVLMVCRTPDYFDDITSEALANYDGMVQSITSNDALFGPLPRAEIH